MTDYKVGEPVEVLGRGSREWHPGCVRKTAGGDVFVDLYREDGDEVVIRKQWDTDIRRPEPTPLDTRDSRIASLESEVAQLRAAMEEVARIAPSVRLG